ncbi:tetraspanin-32 isoform X1 [Sarcophilus harrisii]|uniref:tetraspanin-32 isoform X1 n=1 Tax=Sarcophilus harrisii TaxID=9305 RepID=UPI001301BD82|nr:tetraspanin-32 isoform X1 [Sarcophilus harrisii]
MASLQLLSLSMGALTALGRFGDRFVVLLAVSPEKDPYGPMHHLAFSLGIFLTLLLTLGVVLSILAVVREAKGLMAGGFLSFTLVFLVAVQVTFWRYREPSQVEDTMLDTYDLAYEQATRNVSDIWWQKLVAIHDTFGCCGKSSPLSWLGQEEKDLCKAVRQRAGCLREISSFVREHLSLVSLLFGVTLAFMVPTTPAQPKTPTPPPAGLGPPEGGRAAKSKKPRGLPELHQTQACVLQTGRLRPQGGP